jgi:hypothetical protein
MTAALTRTEPTLVWARSTVAEAEEMTANVVPGFPSKQIEKSEVPGKITYPKKLPIVQLQ